ncbi:MAG TPA: alanine racemase [Edaphobacter sp.]
MHISELDTPSLLLDLDIMERNLRRMGEYCTQHNIALRPHIKTHKIPAIAKLQIAHGAHGITAAKPSEAAVMSEGGIDDIFIAYPIVSAAKANALVDLMQRGTRISVSLDSVEAAECLSQAAAARGLKMPLLVEIDTGFHRCGVATPAGAVALAQTIDRLPGAIFGGLMYYPGHMFVPIDEQQPLREKVNEAVEAAYTALTTAGFAISTVTGGSSPTAYTGHLFSHTTEIRPGMYHLNDRNLVEAGFATLADCALTVLATVVSTAVPGQVILDGGSKTFSSDRLLTGNHKGHGAIVEDPNALLFGLSEEHGHVNITSSSRHYRIGERLRIVPNHVCTAINMHDRIYGIRNDEVVEIWPVAARGKVQ